MAITRIRIFPSIGIARLGNAETEFFIGPEIPGEHERPDGGYKDATCRIKRQAARFRLYAYDENDQLIFENGKPKEITAADGKITWNVQLANTKGSSQRFHPIDSTERRNKGIDVRVFRVVQDETPFDGIPAIGDDKQAALTFIENVITRFNQPFAGTHPFDAILTDDPNASTLRLAQKEGLGDDAKPVFNFAVARVRNQSQVSAAKNVRVFFRLFNTAATGLDYAATTTYRRSAADESAIALLGLDATGTVVDVPCFARARVDSTAVPLTQQPDDLNVRTIPPASGKDQAEAHAYFGCWLDLNQGEPLFPPQPGLSNPDGPWPGVERLTIQQLMKAEHQCLVAEIHFPADPTPSGATMDDRRLAQRNLVFVESANPGDSATRTVQHTFAIKAVSQASLPESPDELMIRWESLPRDTRMRLYMPELDAGELHRLAGRVMGYPGFKPVDAHTVECHPADVTYVPIPPRPSRPIAALLTLELPAGVKRGQLFGLSLHQRSGSPHRVVGSFQFNIPVSTSAALLAPEISRLSVLRHIFRTIPIDDPWHAVFVRYLAQIAARVRGFGGDPDAVAPAADGSGRDPAQIRCERLERLFAALLAVAVVLGGVVRPPIGALLALVALVIAAIAEWQWRKTCAPPWCRIALAGGAGVAIGAAVLGLLRLLGLGGASLVTWLAIAAVLAATLLVGALASGCCRSPPGA